MDRYKNRIYQNIVLIIYSFIYLIIIHFRLAWASFSLLFSTEAPTIGFVEMTSIKSSLSRSGRCLKCLTIITKNLPMMIFSLLIKTQNYSLNQFNFSRQTASKKTEVPNRLKVVPSCYNNQERIT